MEAKKRQRGWEIWALYVAIFLCYAYFFLDITVYKYPKISNVWNFLIFTIPNFVLPVIAIVVMAVFIVKKVHIGTIICAIVIPVLMVVGAFRSIGEALYMPAFCSYTDRVENFADYEPQVEELLALNLGEDFPVALPEDAENVRYCYFYQSTSCDNLYIAVSWEQDAEEMELLLDTLSSSYEISGDGQVWSIDLTEQTASGLSPYLNTVAFVDQDNCTVTYVTTKNKDLLPSSNSNVFWEMQSILDVIGH